MNTLFTLKELYKKLFRIPPDHLKNLDMLDTLDVPQDIKDILVNVQKYTMTSIERQVALIDATKYIHNSNIPGAIVECGVWRGGSMMAVALTLKSLGCECRDLYLFDTYSGMTNPSIKDIDISGNSASVLLKNEEKSMNSSLWCLSSLDEVTRNMNLTKYDINRIHCVKGDVETTIPKSAPSEIALLRLDTDWYQSTKHELEHLFPRLVKGGVIIIDDYGHWRGCREAVDEYFTNHNISILLNRIDYTGRLAINFP